MSQLFDKFRIETNEITGRVIVSNCDIDSWTCILEESPIVLCSIFMSHEEKKNLVYNPINVLSIVQKLLEQNIKLDDLKKRYKVLAKTPISLVYENQKNISQRFKSMSVQFNVQLPELLEMAQIVRANFFYRRNPLSLTITGSCLYEKASLVNHSCEPNCIYFVKCDGTFVLCTIRKIEKDEELTISYTTDPPVMRPSYKTRQCNTKRDFGFTCICTKCIRESTVGTPPLVIGSAVESCANRADNHISSTYPKLESNIDNKEQNPNNLVSEEVSMDKQPSSAVAEGCAQQSDQRCDAACDAVADAYYKAIHNICTLCTNNKQEKDNMIFQMLRAESVIEENNYDMAMEYCIEIFDKLKNHRDAWPPQLISHLLSILCRAIVMCGIDLYVTKAVVLNSHNLDILDTEYIKSTCNNLLQLIEYVIQANEKFNDKTSYLSIAHTECVSIQNILYTYIKGVIYMRLQKKEINPVFTIMKQNLIYPGLVLITELFNDENRAMCPDMDQLENYVTRQIVYSLKNNIPLVKKS
jgi:uncharacterized protein YsxB (DUF464 family)